MLKLIPTGNEELDLRLGGGIPYPSLLTIEGPHGSGKSVFAQQITYGSLKSKLKVLYITTESTTKLLILQSRIISLDITIDFLKGLVDVISIYIPSIKALSNHLYDVLKVLSRYLTLVSNRYDVFIIDSLTGLTLGINSNDITNFYFTLKKIVNNGKLVVVTIHEGAFPEELLVRLRAMSDSYFKLGHTEVGGRSIKVLKVVKLRGVPQVAETTIAYDIDPSFGIKIIPLALAKT